MPYYLVLNTTIYAQVSKQKWPDIIKQIRAAWFATDEAKAIAENVLLYQRNIGGWPKNIQMQNPLTAVEKQNLIALKSPIQKKSQPIMEQPLRKCFFFLKCMLKYQMKDIKMLFLLDLDYLLKAQYENGGWPQFYPLKKRILYSYYLQ